MSSDWLSKFRHPADIAPWDGEQEEDRVVELPEREPLITPLDQSGESGIDEAIDKYGEENLVLHTTPEIEKWLDEHF